MTTTPQQAPGPILSIATNHDAMIILTEDFTAEQKIRAVDAHVQRQVQATLAAVPGKGDPALNLNAFASYDDYAVYCAEIKRLHASISAPVGEVVAATDDEPTILWGASDPEDGAHGNSPKDFAETYASNSLMRGETAEVEVLCATRSHTRKMRISVGDTDAPDWLSWEWVAALPPQAPATTTGE